MLLGRWCAHVHMCRVYVCCDDVFNLCSSMLSWKWAYFFFLHPFSHTFYPINLSKLPMISLEFVLKKLTKTVRKTTSHLSCITLHLCILCWLATLVSETFKFNDNQQIAELMFIVRMTNRKKSMRSMVCVLFFVSLSMLFDYCNFRRHRKRAVALQPVWFNGLARRKRVTDVIKSA